MWRGPCHPEGQLWGRTKAQDAHIFLPSGKGVFRPDKLAGIRCSEAPPRTEESGNESWGTTPERLTSHLATCWCRLVRADELKMGQSVRKEKPIKYEVLIGLSY